MPSFRAKLFRWTGPAAWHFVTIPKRLAPLPTEGWGRTPVSATVDGMTWKTSVWWDTKTQSTLLAIPKKIRKAKGDGDVVQVEVDYRPR